MPERWLTTAFVEGLTVELKRIVKPQDLKDLEAARRAALRAEASHVQEQINMVRPHLDNKMDMMIDLLTQLCSNRQAAPRTQPTNHHQQKSRNNSVSDKEARHTCRHCQKLGHYGDKCEWVKGLIAQALQQTNQQNQ